MQLTPQVTGTVNAEDTKMVKAGDPVVTLGSAGPRIRLLYAERGRSANPRKESTLYVNKSCYMPTLPSANPLQPESRTI